MGRLSEELRSRTENFGDRMLDVVRALEAKRIYPRVIHQMVGCGTSVGANTCEADQAASARDFCRALGIVLKELSESAYWLRMCVRRGWLTERRLAPLLAECDPLARIFGTMVARTRRKRA